MAEQFDGRNQTSPTAPLGPEHGLHFELELLSRHLDILVLEGAELCFPATVVQAKQRQQRIDREIEGELHLDAANDMIVQREMLARLERQLDYVKSQQVCKLPINQSQNTPGEMGERIQKLLNSDDQFAFNSPDLNPKYMGQLARAAELLRNYPGYHLSITGHADAVGSTEANNRLSRARAEQVARYLKIFGFPSERIEVVAVGADDPLFEGSGPQVRLTNRRVTIELIEAIGTLPANKERQL
jgi:outer membrane protein OmpA-like peptidoglycan-associated protein